MSKDFYFEHTIKLNSKSYLTLLQLYFEPKEFFNTIQNEHNENDLFDKIFPINPDYLDNHKIIQQTKDFLSWNGWIFRGHRDSSWVLCSKLERLYSQSTIKDRTIFEVEQGLIRDFKRRRGNYGKTVNEVDIYETIANMQHYGLATRFLDFSYSFFVALYFACRHIKINTNKETKGSFSIWCVNRMWLESTYKKYLPEEIKKKYENDKFGKLPETQESVLNYVNNKKKNGEDYLSQFRSVINMTPFYMNDRLERQRGTFLFQTNLFTSFMDNMQNLVALGGKDKEYRILKINVEYDEKTLLYLKSFLNEMNINDYILFNDLEHLSSSINQKVFFPNDSIISNDSYFR